MTLTRRRFFESVADGLCGAALATLLSKDVFGAELSSEPRRVFDMKPRAPNFAPKAKAIIQLFMNGGPSPMDLLDPKLSLDKHHGDSYFDKVAADLTGPEQAGGIMRSPFKFAQYGKSGIWVSEVMPHLAKQVDHICVIRSMHTLHPNHEPALFVIHSGRTIPGRPE